MSSNRHPVPRLMALALSTPWAMEENALRNVFSILARQNEPLEAVASRLGRELDNAQGVTLREDGIAVIELRGPIVRYATWLTDVSGAATVERLATDLQKCLDNPAVRAIVLSIDSPGGEVNGTAELAQLIQAATERKPVYGYAGGYCASAAYWLGSACTELVVGETALVGSIGVYWALQDRSQRDSAMGVQTFEFRSSQSPNKRPDPSSEHGQEQIQEMLDSLCVVFLERVAEYRGVTVETVLADFGQGAVFVGAEAVRRGMADRVSTFEALLAEIASGGSGESGLSFSRQTALGAAERGKEKGMSKQGQGLGARLVTALASVGIRLAEDAEEQAEATARVEPLERLQVGMVEGAALKPVVSEREKELEAQIAAIQRDRFTDQAKAFAAQMVQECRAFPAEADSLVASYVQAAMDDSRNPAQLVAGEGTSAVTHTSRVAALKATYEKRTPHALTTESVPSTAFVLPAANPTGLEAAVQEVTDTTRAWAEQQNRRK